MRDSDPSRPDWMRTRIRVVKVNPACFRTENVKVSDFLLERRPRNPSVSTEERILKLFFGFSVCWSMNQWNFLDQEPYGTQVFWWPKWVWNSLKFWFFVKKGNIFSLWVWPTWRTSKRQKKPPKLIHFSGEKSNTFPLWPLWRSSKRQERPPKLIHYYFSGDNIFRFPGWHFCSLKIALLVKS